MDENHRVVDCSELYSQDLFGKSAAEFRELTPHVVHDLTPERFREKTEEVLKHKDQHRSPLVYFTWLQFGVSKLHFVGVYAFPVDGDEGENAGALGIIKPF